MNNAKVSVVIPCYNVEKYLDNCFKCLDNQTYKNIEVILVDDGSKDKTLERLLEQAKNKENYKVITHENKGIASARNSGIEVATGEYLYFYDPDDILHPRLIEKAVEITLQNNSDITIFNYKRVKDGKRYENYSFSKIKNNKIRKYNKIDCLTQYLSSKIFFLSVWNKLYSAKIIRDNNIRFWDGCRYSEDTYFNYIYMKNVEKAVYFNDVLYYYVQRKNSLVHDNFKETKLDCFYSLNYIVKDAFSYNEEIYAYAHGLRTTIACELLYFIKLSNYSNSNVMQTIINYQNEGLPYLKKCKKVALFRRLFIPLVPKVAKLLLNNRIKKGGLKEVLPVSMQGN